MSDLVLMLALTFALLIVTFFLIRTYDNQVRKQTR